MLQLENVLYHLHGNIQGLSHIPTKHAIDNNAYSKTANYSLLLMLHMKWFFSVQLVAFLTVKEKWDVFMPVDPVSGPRILAGPRIT